MAPKTRAKAAAAAAEPSAPKAKRSRASAAAPPASAAGEEANDSAHKAAGPSQGSYEALQQELADLRREMAVLRHPPGPTLAVSSRPLPTAEAEATPSTSTPPLSTSTPPPISTPAPMLRGDPNSPLSVGLETAR